MMRRFGLLYVLLALPIGCTGRSPTQEGGSALLDELRQRFPAAAGRLRAEEAPRSQLVTQLPPRADAPLRLQARGVTLEIRAAAAQAAPVRVTDGVAIAREAYRDTDVLQVRRSRELEELLYLKSPRAPTRFVYNVAVSGGTLRPSGEVMDQGGTRRLQLAPTWALDATGRRVDVAVAVAVAARGSQVTVTLDPTGLRYPVLVDPTWRLTAGGLSQARYDHSLVLLGGGQVLACGGTIDGSHALASCDRFAPHGGEWEATTPLATPRTGATMTLVPDGMVLACGGGTASCEEYDPWLETWTPTSSMAASRSGATATLLLDGRVLVVGGDASGSAELYDPVARAWAPAGSVTPRTGATATRLGNGQVLVVGGSGAGGPATDVDLFDPSDDTWASGPPLPVGRAGHTATRLRDDRVLVVGGTDGAVTLATTVLYDESSPGWSAGGPLLEARRNHAAALMPSGDVAILGGENETGILATAEVSSGGGFLNDDPLEMKRARAGAVVLATGDLLVAGGLGQWGPVASSETWTAARMEPQWRQTQPMSGDRECHQATRLLDGTVLVTGGKGWNIYHNSADRYDPSTRAWSVAGPMLSKRIDHAATILADGKVLVTGGYYWYDGDPYYLATAEIYDPVAGTWTATGSMSEPRYRHTATLLQDGKVLVVAGLDPDYGLLPTAELYDPGSGTWSLTGAPAHPHGEGSTATLLNTGMVLVVGGSCNEVCPNGELYNPPTGTWITVGALADPRQFHAATLLQSGKVLLTGGYFYEYPLMFHHRQSAELYDPGSGQFAAAAPATVPRSSHTATRLADGTVLVAGGARYENTPQEWYYLTDAEVYDPATDAWHPTASLRGQREGHVAALLDDGSVLVAGGSYRDPAGGHTLETAELYQPPTHPWSTADPVGTGRWGHSLTRLPDGRILVAGGCDGGPPPFCPSHLSSAALFDPATDTWTATGSLTTPRGSHAATLLGDGKVLVVGGRYHDGVAVHFLDSAEVYDPGTGTWTSVGSLAQGRELHSATLLSNGTVLVAAGEWYDTSVPMWRYLRSAELYDPTSQTFGSVGDLVDMRASHAATALHDGRVLVTGGNYFGTYRVETELYDPGTQTWSSGPPMIEGRTEHTVTLLADGHALVVGGFDHVHRTGAEVFDPIDGTWRSTDPLLHGRSLHTATRLDNGAVLVVGGTCGTECFRPAAELYDPATGSWTPAGDLSGARSLHAAVLLGDGRALFVGGYFDDGTDHYLGDAELYAPSMVTSESWRPVVTPPSVPWAPGGALSLAGTGFRGPCEAAAGHGAAADHPVVKLLGLSTGVARYLAPTRFTDTSLRVTIPPEHALEPTLATVTVAGVSSHPVLLTLEAGGRGGACTSGGECESGNCVSGVCCEVASCPTCSNCNVADAVGTCALLGLGEDDNDPPAACAGTFTCDGAGGCHLENGQACSSAGECASGHCVDGRCCNSACTATCTGCAVAGSLGSCVNLPLGSLDDSPPGACLAPAACNGAGGCKLADGQTCAEPTACASGRCVDGVCCNSWCDAPCFSCVVAGSEGTCTPTPQTLDDPPACWSGRACDGTSAGAAACRLANGALCSADSACASGFCRDGVCCESACDAPCRYCAAGGTCTDVPAGQEDLRPADACTGGSLCNGAGVCLLALGQPCTEPTLCLSGVCADGVCCEGSCGGFRCGATGTCLVSCSTTGDCRDGYYCDPGTSSCKARSANGTACEEEDECQSGYCVEGECCEASWCDGFACQAGACRTDCVRDDQCAPSWSCDVGSGTCLAPAGHACEADSTCQSGTCAGGHCCGGACGTEDAACAGTCDESGTCTYPHDGRPCSCTSGAEGLCVSGGCACADAPDGGAAPDATGPGVDEGGGGCSCRLNGTRPTHGAFLLVLLLPLHLLRSRRRLPRGRG